MRHAIKFILPVVFLLASCQSEASQTITIIDGEQILQFNTKERIPKALLAQAGIHLSADDIVLRNGEPIPIDQDLPVGGQATLQIRRAVTLTINGNTVPTAAFTIDEALSQTGVKLYASDRIIPPGQTAINGPTKVVYQPSAALTVAVDGKTWPIRSSASSAGRVLAEAGLPILGMDIVQPAENEVLPSSGQLVISRVTESILLAEKPIPFKTDYQQSPDVELDQQQVLQAGQPGLSISRVRIVYENGKEISRQTESETAVRAPQDQIVGYGTKVVIHTTTVNGVQIQYWRVVSMYATAYSPCNSAMTGCSYGTASGLPAGKGVVAVDPSLYSLIAGQRLFIPGYGTAVVGDVGGGYIIEQKLGIARSHWIDLGYSDAECRQYCDQWSTWVTVYFLAPPPASIPRLN